ncbi:MAG: 30S ribosomal protein S8 [Candidatus Falkowbacteria bacterium]
MTDPIADMLTRIRNATAVKKTEVLVPMSKVKYAIAKILEQNHWLGKVEKMEQDGLPYMQLTLKYQEDGKPAISSIQRVSRPGRRTYASKDELPRVLNNFGIAIISTSQGLMTNKEAGKKKIGGEVICEIY